MNLLATGQAPSSIFPHLCSATLLACGKKNGLRPIAVGEVLRRLISKSLATATRHDAFNSLAPLQLGVCVRGGCEAIIHSVSHLTRLQLHLSSGGFFYWTSATPLTASTASPCLGSFGGAFPLCHHGWSPVLLLPASSLFWL